MISLILYKILNLQKQINNLSFRMDDHYGWIRYSELTQERNKLYVEFVGEEIRTTLA